MSLQIKNPVPQGKKSRKDFVKFIKGRVLMSVLGHNYEAVVDVVVKTNGKYVLYDLVDMKDTSFEIKKEGASTAAQAGNAVAPYLETPSMGDTVPHNDGSVKFSTRNAADDTAYSKETKAHYDLQIPGRSNC